MKFLVNPECYHKMCESCVDRIFSQGPAPCPVAGCARTLRKHRFRKQTFDDINIEREVDIRARVAKVYAPFHLCFNLLNCPTKLTPELSFNRREAEFTTLLDYNNYLEKVEILTFNLIYNIDVSQTEALLASHAAQNAAAISRNAALDGVESASVSADLSTQREAAKARREAARKEEEEEKREKQQGRREVLEKIANSTGDADVVAKEARSVVLKKSTARRTITEKLRAAAATPSTVDPFSTLPLQTITNSSTKSTAEFQIEGLKPVIETEPEKPYDAFGGVTITGEYHVLRDHYDHPWLDQLRTDPHILAGGYDLHEYYSRTMLEAFAGIGIIIGEEFGDSDGLAETEEIATAGTVDAVVVDV